MKGVNSQLHLPAGEDMQYYNSRYTVFSNRLLFIVLLFFSLSSQAALLGRDLDGNTATIEAVYDDVLDITWLANANLAASNRFGIGGISANGEMNWSTAINWIAAMNHSDSGEGYLGFNDWRLPYQNPNSVAGFNTVNYDPGTGALISELGYLYYENLGGRSGAGYTLGSNINLYGFTNAVDTNNYLNLFSNIQNFLAYWTGTSAPNGKAWAFGALDGGQGTLDKTHGSMVFAWAVRSGDVAGDISTVIPIPPAIWLFGSALLGLMGLVRRPG